MAADQLFMAPLGTAAFFAWTKTTEGKASEAVPFIKVWPRPAVLKLWLACVVQAECNGYCPLRQGRANILCKNAVKVRCYFHETVLSLKFLESMCRCLVVYLL